MQKLRAEAAAKAKVVQKVRREQKELIKHQAEFVAENERIMAENQRAKQLIEQLRDALDQTQLLPYPQPDQPQPPPNAPVRASALLLPVMRAGHLDAASLRCVGTLRSRIEHATGQPSDQHPCPL